MDDLFKIFWNNKIIKPILNSIAEKIKKKNVKDNTFKLLKMIPISKTIVYKIIHNNSAISNKFKDEFVLISILMNNNR